LSWRSPVRRTSALIYGERGLIEIEGECVTLTDRSGGSEDLSAADIADDSYHSAWFAGMAADFERAVIEGAQSRLAKRNLEEARATLSVIIAARESASNRSAEIKIPAIAGI
jgi:predicted dehydrogenase